MLSFISKKLDDIATFLTLDGNLKKNTFNIYFYLWKKLGRVSSKFLLFNVFQTTYYYPKKKKKNL